MALIEAPSEKEVVASKHEFHEPHTFRWTSEAYHKAGDANLFLNRRVQLINGEIIEMSAMGSRHFSALGLGMGIISAAFGKGFAVCIQSPLHLADGQEPEPDLAVIMGTFRDYAGSLPTSAVLVVEISDTTLLYDQNTKARIYAVANIAEFWIINLRKNVLEVYRNPVSGKYDPKVVYRRGQSLAPLAAPQSLVLVDDLLP